MITAGLEKYLYSKVELSQRLLTKHKKKCWANASNDSHSFKDEQPQDVFSNRNSNNTAMENS